LFGTQAGAELCNPSVEACWDRLFKSSSSTPAVPTSSSTIRINPSAVPVEKGFGIEAIGFKKDVDFALVQGLGRVGAAISPSASEETFFGPPGVEDPYDYLLRLQQQTKYPNQKTSLATAFKVFGGHSSGLHRFDMNLGVMARYNRVTGAVTPGGGITTVAGPFTFGYSLYRDETQLTANPIIGTETQKYRYLVEMYSAGVSLNSVALDYSIMHMIATDTATIALTTASLIVKRGIFTASYRREDSNRLLYNYKTNLLETVRVKDDLFFGAQISAGSHVMAGVFYNYYILRELSIGLTLMF
jgi:hypothetical protein